MKYLFLILLIPFLLYPQGFHSAEMGKRGMGLAKKSNVSIVTYEPEVTAFNNALTTKLSSTTLDTLDLFCKMLKDSLSLTKGVSNLNTRYDRLWMLWLPTQEASLKDIVNLSNADSINNPTYRAWHGWAGASGKYINTNFTPSTSASILTLNSTSMAFWGNNDIGAGAMADCGVSQSATALLMQSRYSGNVMYSSINELYEPNVSNSSEQGLMLINRSGSATGTFYRNGLSLGAPAGASVSLNTIKVYLCLFNNNGTPSSSYSTNEYSIFYLGNSRTSAEALKEYHCFLFLKTAEGF
jgi:hypothetical protein